ncbi:hypothetical protein A3A69_00270 [candidate division WWE3 bacterium RIFCSPLOWO2_01_FULL_37_15]|uniref:Uncharacterized protein n=1 Tax=candidate division WWE3 bacterium RIFCSPLOWO2_01_FULL_37_15 TaxID=1802622 RepID=A0A1F4V1C5_UNCKA|nr:MAG: hypothetical protein A3A69_00270 [candidate division WWE3 bacterium RIFCSPLOWO2_01_FULL_37_15]
MCVKYNPVVRLTWRYFVFTITSTDTIRRNSMKRDTPPAPPPPAEPTPPPTPETFPGNGSGQGPYNG